MTKQRRKCLCTRYARLFVTPPISRHISSSHMDQTSSNHIRILVMATPSILIGYTQAHRRLFNGLDDDNHRLGYFLYYRDTQVQHSTVVTGYDLVRTSCLRLSSGVILHEQPPQLSNLGMEETTARRKTNNLRAHQSVRESEKTTRTIKCRIRRDSSWRVTESVRARTRANSSTLV
jgi:hypothetical protein